MAGNGTGDVVVEGAGKCREGDGKVWVLAPGDTYQSVRESYGPLTTPLTGSRTTTAAAQTLPTIIYGWRLRTDAGITMTQEGHVFIHLSCIEGIVSSFVLLNLSAE